MIAGCRRYPGAPHGFVPSVGPAGGAAERIERVAGEIRAKGIFIASVDVDPCRPPGGAGSRWRAGWLAAGLAIAAFVAVGCGDAPDAAQALASLETGVARVQVVWWDTSGAERSRAFGTAFRVGAQGYLVTAQHVAANARAQRANFGPQTRARVEVAFAPTARAPATDASGSLSVEVAFAAEDPDADLALLRIVEPPPSGGWGAPAGGLSRGRAARLASAPPPAGSPVAVAGYPIGARDLVVRSGRLLDPALVASALGGSESLPGWLDELLRDDAVLLADVETRLGNSGAPIYLAESGEIVGLCSAVLLRNRIARDELIPLPHPPGDPITLIVAAQRIRSFLDAHSVSAR